MSPDVEMMSPDAKPANVKAPNSRKPSDGEPAAALPRRAWHDRPWIVAFFFAALTVAMTFPLAFRLTTHVPAGAVDLWQNYWNFWWWKTALLDLRVNPYATDYLFFPSGADLAFYTHSVFNMLTQLPTTALLGPAAAYNGAVLLQTTLSGWSAWLLARHLTRDSRAALLAGIVFAFFPQRMEQTTEHLNLMSTGFIPLIFLYLIKLFETETRRRDAVWLGLSFALNALCDWHLGLMTTMAAAALGVWLLIRPARPRGAIVLNLVLAGTISGALTLPFAWPLVRGMLGGETFFQKMQEPRGIDLAFTLLPSFHHPIFGALTWGAYAGRAYEAAGFTSYLGFVPLGLAALAAARRARGTGFWVALFAGSLVLALGAHPWVNSRLMEDVTLPFALLSRLPVLSLLRVANRFLIYASLALAVLTAWGWSVSRWRGGSRGFALVACLVLLEYLWLPYPTQPTGLSRGLDRMSHDRVGGADAVLTIPFNANGRTVQNMVDQTRHHRKIPGGYLSTTPPAMLDAIRNEPELMNLVGADLTGVEPALDRPVNVARLRELGFGWVIMRKDRADGRAAELKKNADPRDLFQRKILSRLGGIPDAKFARIRGDFKSPDGSPPFFEDDQIVIFNLSDVMAPEVRKLK